MTKPKSASSVLLGNRIQSAVAKAVKVHGNIKSALVVMIDKQTEEIHHIQIVTEDDLTDIVLMYEDKTR